MLIGDVDLPLEEAILAFVLIGVLVINTLLFRQGSHDYSIKYKLMERHQVFRENQIALMLVEYLYKGFFVLPFMLLIAITVIQSIKNILNLPTILINGLIIVLIVFPTKTSHFYVRMIGIWALTFGSQLSTLFIHLTDSQYIYYVLSIIFYSGNILFFFLGLLAIEGCYWQISEAIMKFKSEVKDVNEEWVLGRDKIPFIFHGGVYGLFCYGNENHKSFSTYLLMYLISLAFLGVYAYLVYLYTDSYLGIVGLVSNIIFDIFIKIFAKLEVQGRSLTTIFIILVAGRTLSFCFGNTLWLLGYCILYFGVSIFIGWMIINHRLPLKDPQKKPVRYNALKSPQFVLFILSVEIIIMIISEVYGVKSTENVQYNNIEIPIWQWGILGIIGAWAVIIYLVSVRIYMRHRYKIYALNEYYFGTETVTEQHFYKLLSYLLIIGLGLYSYLYLNDKILFVCCIFIPMIFLCLQSISVAWTKNQYQVLADIDDYNKQAKKLFDIKKKRKEMIEGNKKLKQMQSKLKIAVGVNADEERQEGFLSQLEKIKKGTFTRKNDEDQSSKKSIKLEQNQTKNNLNLIFKDQAEDENREQQEEYVPLKNWRNPDEEVNSFWEIISNFTSNDRTIIRFTILLLILLIGFCCTCFFWGQSKFGFSFSVCLVSYLTLSPYYRSYKRKCQILIPELIGAIIGFALGITYWSVFNSQVIGPLAYGFVYLFVASTLLYYVISSSLSILIMASLGILIGLMAIFILATFGIQTQLILVSIFAFIFCSIGLCLVMLYYQLVYKYVPNKVIISCSILIGGGAIGLAVTGYILEVLSSFALLTISLVLVYLVFLSASIGLAAKQYNKLEKNVIVYSPYGVPHYIFDSSEQRLKEKSTYMVLFSFSSITLVIYAGVVSIFFIDKEYAIGVLSYLQLTNTFVELMTSLSAYYFIGRYKQYVTDEIILKALKKLKDNYMDETQRTDSSYYRAEFQAAKAEAKSVGGNQNWKKVVKYRNLYVKNVKQQQKFLFFWIALIKFYAVASKRQMMQKAIIEVKQIEQELNNAGIFLEELNSNLHYKQKYKRLQNQIKCLEPLNFIIYEEILENHRADEENKKQRGEQFDKINENQQAERDQDIYEKIKQVGEPQEEISKFQQLVHSLGKKKLFADEQFPANENSLGFLQSQVDSWRRPNVGEMLVKGTMSADDVKQGNIGDCYLISSFGVLGDTRIKQALGINKNGQQIWTNSKGAYMVRFYKFSKEVYIIIDDLLPVNQSQEWVFARSEDQNQFWPCILEKAYAKLYKGYHNIVAGKCHRVLAQFTNGFPFQKDLPMYKENPNGLWTQIMTAKNNGYLMGAGTPSHPDGDRAFSKRGIVKGHAYSVLDARQVDEYRLIKLKNPHGSAGREWIGDFSDDSDMMTKGMIEKLDHSLENDGLFWMTVEDFIHEFKSLYICAIFNPEKWNKIGPIHGEWTQENSNGLPNIPGCEKNPQYGITVNKACSLFVSLTQQSKSALKGKHFIYMRIQKNNGTRMKEEHISSDNLIDKDGPRDAVSLSCEVKLQASQYPSTFTLMVCTAYQNETGTFMLEFYSDDKEFKIIEDDEFDLQSKK